jgi:hypothetical protein
MDCSDCHPTASLAALIAGISVVLSNAPATPVPTQSIAHTSPSSASFTSAYTPLDYAAVAWLEDKYKAPDITAKCRAHHIVVQSKDTKHDQVIKLVRKLGKKVYDL